MRKALFMGLLLAVGCDAPAGEAGEDMMTPGEACKTPAARLWKLTPDQLSNTVAALLPAAGRVGDSLYASLSQTDGVFDNEASSLEMTQPHVDQLFEVMRAAADPVQKAPEQLTPCLSAAAPDRACVRSFIEDYGARGLRRPLREEEIGGYLDDYYKNRTDFGNRAALAMFLRGLLMAPELLYRTELGPEAPAEGGAPPEPAVVTMTSHERASAISYLLTEGPPDAQLRAAAQKGELETREQLAAQARRLLAQPESARGVERLFAQLFRLKEVPFVRKTKANFPTYSLAIGTDLAEETRRFIQHVLWQDGGKLSTLLTASYSIVNRRLADYYGVPTTQDGFTRVDFPKERRMGLLTHASVLSLFANEIETSPVMRGKFVRERILCQPIPPPPPTVNAIPPRPDGMSTQRERLARHSADSSCANCHRLMDPIGLALESFDGVGLFRTTEHGKTIETAGKLSGLATGERDFSSTGQLIQTLAEEPQVSSCFAKTVFLYASGRAAQSCEEAPLQARFAASGGDVLDLLVAMVSEDGVYLRQRGGKE